MTATTARDAAAEDPGQPPPAPAFGEALRFWWKLGWISFGGPAGQIAILHAELVQRRRWLSEARFLHALNYCMVLPGPEAQQLATYLGWLLHRTRGGLAAGLLFVLPGLAVLIALAAVYMVWGRQPWLAAVLWGLKPAVVAIVLHACWRIGGRVLRGPVPWAIAGAAFVALAVLQAPFPAVLIAAAAIGWAFGRWGPDHLPPPGHAAPRTSSTASAPGVPRPAFLIDDHTPPPEHARHRPGRLLRVLGVALVLWGLPLALLTAWVGWQGDFTRMAIFFTQAALLTFGGAYAVLPYVLQGAVQQQGWITTGQMMDGLALGETTPGPLILVVAFVGFVGAWQSPEVTALFGPGQALAAGVFGALLVSWFTFLPSFVFILAGAPWIESTRGRLGLDAPLSAITAAVVGVIASLGLWFALHVGWPRGWDRPPDAAAIALAAVAAWLLIRRGWSVMRVIGASAAAGGLAGWAGWVGSAG